MKIQVFFKYLVIIVLVAFMASCGGEEVWDPKEFDTPAEKVATPTGVTTTATAEETTSIGKVILVLLITIVLGAGIFYFFYAFIPIKLWYEARLSKVHVEWITLFRMYFQKVPQEKILKLLIKTRNAGIVINAKDLSNHYLAHVDIDVVTNTLIRAHNASLKIDLNQLAAQYLARVDVEKVLHSLIMAKNAGIDTNLQQLASFYLANVDVEKIITAKIRAKNSNYEIPLDSLKEHYLAGGNIAATVEGFVAAKKASLPESEFSDIAGIDLAGYDVVKAVHSAITPRIVETDGVKGVARDGVEIILKVKVTLRAFIKSIIGGVSSETVLARVNEALATEIGMSASHYDILQSPFELADKVEKRGLSDRSSYEIISIDVSDITVGKNIHAEQKMELAMANAEQAKAELIVAEERVQRAIAAAFLDGKLSIHEYHDMKNTEADTEMRKKLGNSVKKDTNVGGHNSHNTHSNTVKTHSSQQNQHNIQHVDSSLNNTAHDKKEH